MTAPWTRQRNEEGELEPMLWYRRFSDYRLMGPDRKLLAAVNAWRVEKGGKKRNFVPGAWVEKQREWQWDERSEAWDQFILDQRIAEDEAERVEWRKKRRALLAGFFIKTTAALKDFDPEGTTLAQLTGAVRIAIDEIRTEYNEDLLSSPLVNVQQNFLQQNVTVNLLEDQLRQLPQGKRESVSLLLLQVERLMLSSGNKQYQVIDQ